MIYQSRLNCWIALAVFSMPIIGYSQTENVNALIQNLRSSVPKVRDEAKRALANIGKPAVPPLITLLSDENEFVRLLATDVLGEIKDVRAVEPLIATFRDESYSVRHSAAEALVEIKDVRTVESLIAALKNENSDVRQLSVYALGKIDDARVIKPLLAALKDDHLGVRREALAGLVRRKTGKDEFNVLLAALTDGDETTRNYAIERLGEIKDRRAIDTLITVLKGEDSYSAYVAGTALLKFDLIPFEILITLLKDEKSYNASWRFAIAALGKSKDPRAAEPLIGIVKEDGLVISKKAQQALVELGLSAEGLIMLLKSPYDDIRREAAKKLGDLKDIRGIEPLMEGLNDEDSIFRFNAANSLGKIGTLNYEPLITSLIANLRNENWKIRVGAAIALGVTKDKRAIEALNIVLQDTSVGVGVRLEAAKALTKISPSVEAWIIALRWGDKDIQMDAIWELGEARDVRAVEPLIATLEDDDLYIQNLAQEALVKIGAPAVDQLIAALQDKHFDVRRKAAKALGEIRDPRAVIPLTALLKDKLQIVATDAAWALGQINDDKAIEYLIASMNDNDPNVRREATYAFLRFKSPRKYEVMMEAFKNENLAVIAAAHDYFISLGIPGSEKLLIDALTVHGDKEMAENFLNCGNHQLKEAAEIWANRHGYEVKQSTSSTVWGKQ